MKCDVCGFENTFDENFKCRKCGHQFYGISGGGEEYYEKGMEEQIKWLQKQQTSQEIREVTEVCDKVRNIYGNTQVPPRVLEEINLVLGKFKKDHQVSETLKEIGIITYRYKVDNGQLKAQENYRPVWNFPKEGIVWLCDDEGKVENLARLEQESILIKLRYTYRGGKTTEKSYTLRSPKLYKGFWHIGIGRSDGEIRLYIEGEDQASYRLEGEK